MGCLLLLGSEWLGVRVWVVSSLGLPVNENMVLRSVQQVGTVAEERKTNSYNKVPLSCPSLSEGSIFWKWGSQQAVSEGGVAVPKNLLFASLPIS